MCADKKKCAQKKERQQAEDASAAVAGDLAGRAEDGGEFAEDVVGAEELSALFPGSEPTVVAAAQGLDNRPWKRPPTGR